MIWRTFASVFPRHPPSSLIFWSINAEADSAGTGFFIYRSNSRTYFTCASRRSTRAPEHAGGRRPAPRHRASDYREVSDERRNEVDGETAVDPLLESRRRKH